MRSDCKRVSPESNDWYFYKRKKREIWTSRQEETQDKGHTKEAGGGGGNTGTLGAARGPQKLGEAWGRSFLEASEGTCPAGTLSLKFCLQNYVVFSPPVCGTFLLLP